MNKLEIGGLKVSLPIVQGGMGVGVSLSGLASAVANQGGIGIISTVVLGAVNNPDKLPLNKANILALKDEIRKSRIKSSGVIGVNIMCALTDYAAMVETALDEGIDIIFSGAGLPLDLPKYLKPEHKTKLVPIVSSVRAAEIIFKKWKQNYDYIPDAVVVEGPKAGGHLGFSKADMDKEEFQLESLVPQLKVITDAYEAEFGKNIPIIAAGGIFTGADMYNIMKLGASAVQLGTRFVATEECDASIEFKQAFVNAKESDTVIIDSPVGMPGRALLNQFIIDSKNGITRPKNCSFNCLKTCNPKTVPYCIANALVNSYRGNIEDGFVFAGANAYKVTEITTVKAVIDDLVEGYRLEEINQSK